MDAERFFLVNMKVEDFNNFPPETGILKEFSFCRKSLFNLTGSLKLKLVRRRGNVFFFFQDSPSENINEVTLSEIVVIAPGRK